MITKKLVKRPLHRWLCKIGACDAARRWVKPFRSFDAAWKALDKGIDIWWLGDSLLGLGFSWNEDPTKFAVPCDDGINHTTSFDNPKVCRKMKRHIRTRVEAEYRAFLKAERRRK